MLKSSLPHTKEYIKVFFPFSSRIYIIYNIHWIPGKLFCSWKIVTTLCNYGTYNKHLVISIKKNIYRYLYISHQGIM